MPEEGSLPISPKAIVGGLCAIIAAGGAGSMVGVTIEPETTTQLRVEAAELKVRVEYLEGLIEECKTVVAHTRAALASGDGNDGE